MSRFLAVVAGVVLVSFATCKVLKIVSSDVDDSPRVEDLYQPKKAPPEPTTRTGFRWRVEPAKSASLEPWHAIFAARNFPADRLTVGFTKLLDLPRNVPVIGKECGKVGAFYDPNVPSITICYELADFIYKAFRTDHKSSKEALRQTVYALMFMQLHEMAHSFIGELDLGVAGGEEQAADDFAAVLLADISIDGANAMRALGQRSDTPKYFDLHPVGEQRFHNIYCIVYGSDPAKYASFVGNPLDAKRAAGCPEEYRRKRKFWDAQLAAHDGR